LIKTFDISAVCCLIKDENKNEIKKYQHESEWLSSKPTVDDIINEFAHNFKILMQ
jgi:hypothetical protein